MQSAYLMLPTGAPSLAMACLCSARAHAHEVNGHQRRSTCDGVMSEVARRKNCSHVTARRGVTETCRNFVWCL